MHWSLKRAESPFYQPPERAIPCGKQTNDRRTYYAVVCHVQTGYDIPGKAVSGEKAWYPWDGKERRTPHFSWVVTSDLGIPEPGWRLVHSSTCAFPPRFAIPCGRQANVGGKPFYSVVCSTKNGLIPGKGLYRDSAWYPFGDRERRLNDYFYVVANYSEIPSQLQQLRGTAGTLGSGVRLTSHAPDDMGSAFSSELNPRPNFVGLFSFVASSQPAGAGPIQGGRFSFMITGPEPDEHGNFQEILTVNLIGEDMRTLRIQGPGIADFQAPADVILNFSPLQKDDCHCYLSFDSYSESCCVYFSPTILLEQSAGNPTCRFPWNERPMFPKFRVGFQSVNGGTPLSFKLTSWKLFDSSARRSSEVSFPVTSLRSYIATVTFPSNGETEAQIAEIRRSLQNSGLNFTPDTLDGWADRIHSNTEASEFRAVLSANSQTIDVCQLETKKNLDNSVKVSLRMLTLPANLLQGQVRQKLLNDVESQDSAVLLVPKPGTPLAAAIATALTDISSIPPPAPPAHVMVALEDIMDHLFVTEHREGEIFKLKRRDDGRYLVLVALAPNLAPNLSLGTANGGIAGTSFTYQSLTAAGWDLRFYRPNSQ